MDVSDQQFRLRASRIPFHGLGLSVDVYSPPLIDLVQELNERQLSPGYLEIFKAPVSVLQTVRSRVACPFFEYHADGLWVTQPDLWEAYPIHTELEAVIDHLKVLDCCWINQECASKQMAGYSFGTYLPPMLTRLSAEVTASNARSVQDRLDAGCGTDRSVAPLLLLETPPLTYFAYGDLSYLEFFRMVTSQSSCGVVLDIGHLWTVYRYGCYAHTHHMAEFLEVFLSEFPLHRVVQIHVAGLKEHPMISLLNGDETGLPAWIDAHDAPIPEVLVQMLEYILFHGDLTSLKGIALEVDTKSIPRILDDYALLEERLSVWQGKMESDHQKDTVPSFGEYFSEEGYRFISGADRRLLCDAYSDFVSGMTGMSIISSLHQQGLSVTEMEGLHAYSRSYLPCEILEWGGNVHEMFPMTCAAMQQEGVELTRFLVFWFQEPRPNTQAFDFFLLKVQRFVEFIQAESPGLLILAEKEAEALRDGYEFANQLSLDGETMSLNRDPKPEKMKIRVKEIG